MKVIIDATGLKIGRLAQYAAKRALKGDKIDIINIEQAVMTGSRDAIMKKYGDQYTRGIYTKGPFQPRMADRFARRIIRGMLPYRTPRGREAFENIMCFIGNPRNETGEKYEQAALSTTTIQKFMTLKEICQLLGGRHE